MMMRTAATAAMVICFVAPALGAPKRAAAPAGKHAIVVNLENKRAVALTKFQIVAPAADKKPEKIIGSLEKALAAGAGDELKLARAKGCVFEARWKFDDLEDSGSVDLCADSHIVLID